MRVLWLIKGLGPGGAERLLVLAARRRDRARIACHVAYLLPWKDTLAAPLEDEGVAVTCLGARSSWDLRWLPRLRTLLRSERFEVVHSHSPLAAVGARLVVRTLPRHRRPRLVTTEHNLWGSYARSTARVHAATAGLDDAHLAVSGAVRDSMPARLRDLTEVVRYGVDIGEVRAARATRDAVRAALGIAPGELLVGTVANLRATKGYPDLLEAARRVLDDVPTARFVAVGQGPMETELRGRHAELGLGARFAFLGYRDDALAILAACDVYCLASRHEGLPLALMEALVLGLPIVATDVGGVSEVVTHGKEGRLVPAARPDLLAEALELLLRDAALRAGLAERSARRGASLDPERAVRRTEAVYAHVVGR